MKRLTAILCALTLLVPVFAASNHTKGAEPLRIAHGETVNLADYVVPGKTTIFDFTSEYCPPCRAYDQPLLALHQKRADLVIVKVDVNRPGVKRIDWESPVVGQFKLQSIPHFKVYGPDGKLLAEDKLVVNAAGKVTTRESGGRNLVDGWLGN